jgi:hypothetical protein
MGFQAQVDLSGSFMLPVDPNEPVYCICKQVAYGAMVACDNENCPWEWFHLPCIGMKRAPKGKWYCSECTLQKKSGRNF